MPLIKGGDLLVQNQLNIDIRVISRAQAWAEQVRGAYHLLYPHIVSDFSHSDDIQAWIDQVFASHTHGRPGCEGGSVTLKPTSPADRSQVPDKAGKSLNEDNIVLGKVRRGLANIRKLIAGIETTNRKDIR